jgi:hypothetical protein
MLAKLGARNFNELAKATALRNLLALFEVSLDTLKLSRRLSVLADEFLWLGARIHSFSNLQFMARAVKHNESLTLKRDSLKMLKVRVASSPTLAAYMERKVSGENYCEDSP